MERLNIDLPPLPTTPPELVGQYLDAYHHHKDEAAEHYLIRREIAVAMMTRSNVPVTAISEALHISRPTLYAWRAELSSTDDPENQPSDEG